MPPRIHVVGAGLAGLAAAIRLSSAGRAVTLYEAGAQAGGRCRSYLDKELGCRIDNGNHLLLAGNRDAMDYVRAIGAAASFTGPDEARIPFLDLASGERWTLRPNRGRVPWWIFADKRRVPGTRARDYLGVLRLARAAAGDVVPQRLASDTPLYRRLWEPFAVAALNTRPEEASAALLWRTIAESFGGGGGACRPLVPREGLSESLVDPALAMLARAGAEVSFGRRLRRLALAGDRVAGLDFSDEPVPVGAEDAVVLAVPAWVAAELVPEVTAPTAFRGIVNAHYRTALPGLEGSFLGLVGGVAEWVFVKREVVSVTISAAERWLDRPAEELAGLIWRDVAAAYGLDPAIVPPARILKEKRATFAATPGELARRPGPASRWRNLALAGDWTATGLPATIEGAVRSGHSAAATLLAPRVRGGKA
jgi:squalene-associated FAD-dependent desaturase